MSELLKDLIKLSEGKMAQIDAEIRALFRASNEDIVKIETPHVYTYKNHSGDRKYVVHGVVFTKNKTKQKYQDYVYHEVNSTDVKRGLPKKLGGDIVSST